MNSRARIGGLGLLVAAGSMLTAGCSPTSEDRQGTHAALVRSYCLDCHNDGERTSGLSLESIDLSNVHAEADIWERVIRKLRGGMMPPADAPRPEASDRLALVGWLADQLDEAAELEPNPGRTVPLHRLNRNEYANAVRDLLGVDLDVSELLPADDASYGFDNIAGVLKLSPTLLERYLNAADRISRIAVGTTSPFASIDYFRIPDDRSQEKRLPGLPFGTRGGTSIDYAFPVDAEYEIAVELTRNLNEGMPLYAEDQHLEVSIDGERIALFTLRGVPTAAPEPIALDQTFEPLRQADDERRDENAEPAKPAEPPISQIVQTLQLSREERALRNRADENWRVRVPVRAGSRNVTATFVAKTGALDETARLPFLRPYPSGVNIPETRMGSYLHSVEISGPFNVAGPGETPSRTATMSCGPPGGSSEPSASEDEEVCAAAILSRLARRAYRRPVAAEEVEPLLEFYRRGSSGGGFDQGIQLAVKRLLVSPEFLFRIERDPAGVAPDTVYEIDGFELASRLSFFLWSSLPDEELLDVAERGGLADSGERERQVRRMLADPRAEAFVRNFAGQWLFLRNLSATVPVQSRFPDFDDTLRESMRRETELFFESILREDRSALDLLRADYTFLNERLAKHYGIPNIKGSHFRRVTLPADNPRRGLLGQASILAVTSRPDRTSPVVRGKWILENLLGTPPPAPPPNVPALTSSDGAGSVISMRERLAAHRADPNCASCHALMDPLGFSLENFDAVGRWRTLGEAGESIDASGKLPDGTEYVGVDGLRQALLSSDQFVSTLAERMLTYSLGRGVEFYDMPAVRKIVAKAALNDYRLSGLIVAVTESTPFRMRKSAPRSTQP